MALETDRTVTADKQFAGLSLRALAWRRLRRDRAAMVAMGVSAAFLGGAPSAVVGDVVDGRKGGPVVATYQMMSDLGIIIGPLLFGYLADSTGGFAWPFIASLLVASATSVLVMFMPETRKPKVAEALTA